MVGKEGFRRLLFTILLNLFSSTHLGTGRAAEGVLESEDEEGTAVTEVTGTAAEAAANGNALGTVSRPPVDAVSSFSARTVVLESDRSILILEAGPPRLSSDSEVDAGGVRPFTCSSSARLRKLSKSCGPTWTSPMYMKSRTACRLFRLALVT